MLLIKTDVLGILRAYHLTDAPIGRYHIAVVVKSIICKRGKIYTCIQQVAVVVVVHRPRDTLEHRVLIITEVYYFSIQVRVETVISICGRCDHWRRTLDWYNRWLSLINDLLRHQVIAILQVLLALHGVIISSHGFQTMLLFVYLWALFTLWVDL